MICNADGKQYICITCHKKLLKGTVPAQAVCNNLQIIELPSRFRDLRKLEENIIAKRLLLKKVTIMPKVQCPKIKGATCNVPINSDDICKVLPTGKFGYTYQTVISLSPSKYFNQRLLNYSQKFASDSDYIFFCTVCYAAFKIE